MTAATETLDSMIEMLRGLDGGDVGQAVAKRAAPMLLEAVKKTAKAGTDPDGKAWPLRKDGGRALEHAADHIHGSAHGNIVRIVLDGPDVFHHFGATHGGIRRQVIPDAGAAMPMAVTRVLERAARAEIEARAGAVR